ncbi:MAG: alpha/beta fold hydrolase [Acidobacteria bacterium]|nr:alpha/beta fold hydrolase [Acidobacteriota bacterium]
MRLRRVGAAIAAVLAALAVLTLVPEAPPGPTGAWMAAAGLTPRHESVAGLRVRYVRKGAGPAVVLLHGFGASLYTWKDLIPALAPRHDVVALDFPGFGGSQAPPDLAWDLYPRVVLGLMDRLGVPRAALVGHSMGGAVAVMTAAQQPERVERLVLLDSAGFNLRAADRPFLIRLAGSAPAAALVQRFPVRRLLVRTGLRQVFHDDSRVTPERVEEYLAPLARPEALPAIRSLVASGSEAMAERFVGLLGRLHVSTLVVWGREDTWAPVAHASRFGEAIPGSRTVILDGCGHMPQEERPEDTARLLSGFLAP